MANTIVLTGIQSLDPPEDRALLYVNVTVNDQPYQWQVFFPPTANSYDDYLATIAPQVYAEIAKKETDWAVLTPKTRTVEIPGEGTVQIPIAKEEIVRPEIPDYYAKRRDAYPKIGDQLDAFWKGPQSPAYREMLGKIDAVKARYPKPTV